MSVEAFYQLVRPRTLHLLISSLMVAILNPTRDIRCFVRIAELIPFAYRLHVNHIGSIHRILLLIDTGGQLNDGCTRAEGTSMIPTRGHSTALHQVAEFER